MKRLPILVLTILALAACTATVPPTQIDIYKPVRHYPPVNRGTNLKLAYRMVNTGKHAFVFNDILPDCTSITLSHESPELLPPGDSLTLYFDFNTSRNVGLTQHYIRIYGNVLNEEDSLGVYRPGVITLGFDVPIVRPSIDGSDYEEIYFSQKPDCEFLVDGTIEEIASQSFE